MIPEMEDGSMRVLFRVSLEEGEGRVNSLNAGGAPASRGTERGGVHGAPAEVVVVPNKNMTSTPMPVSLSV
jgi:hypothetical protein